MPPFHRRQAAAVALCAAFAIGAAPPPQDVVSQRQTRLKDLGTAFKAINDELRRPEPDLKKVRAAMPGVSLAATNMAAWFPVGTGPGMGLKTKARAEIWTNKSGFASQTKAFANEVKRLQTLTAGSDIDAMKAQAKLVGGACGACHTDFRAKDPG